MTIQSQDENGMANRNAEEKLEELRDKYQEKFEQLEEQKGLQDAETATMDIKREAVQEALEVVRDE